MTRGWMALAAVLGAALPVAAQDGDLRKEVDQLKQEVKALKAEKAAPAPVKEAQLMDLHDTTVLDTLMRETKITGFVDTGYVFNIDRPKNGTNGDVTGTPDGSIRAFDRDSRSFYLHNAQLYLQRAPTKEMIVGYDIQLSFGSDADVFAAGTATGDNFDVQEANVQILMPVGNGILWTFGKFATLAGAEVIESKDNNNYSRSLPFLFAIPFTHTGARATYSFRDEISASIGINNGWDLAVDNNDAKTLEFNLTAVPAKWLKFLVNFYYGAEKAPVASGRNPGDKRMLVDLVAMVSDIPGLPGLTFGINYDLGEEEDSAVSASGTLEDAEWDGMAIYIRYQINEQWAAAFRYSMLGDDNLFRAGVAPTTTGAPRDNTISEFTFTLEYTPVKGLKTRLEYRMDSSDEDIFRGGDSPSTGADLEDSQSTIGVEVIVEF